LPESRIRNAGLKQSFFSKDEEWAVEKKLDQFASSLNLYQTIKKSSAVEYWLAVEEQYMNKHLSKVKQNMKIRRMQVAIEKVNLIETDYSLGAYVNKRNPTKGKCKN
jgi:ribosomal protein L20A (L18A)